MKKKTVRIFAVLLTLALLFGTVQSAVFAPAAKTSSQWQQEINNLKKKQADEAKILEAIRGKISAINAEIAEYNKKINAINAKISANKAEIAKSEKEIDSDKDTFKKRIRSIAMSGSKSGVSVLLGATSFSQFLTLSQMTSSVSSHDKKLIEDLKGKISELNEKNAENEKLVEEQKAAKSKVDAQQAELLSQESQAAAIYNKTGNDVKDAQANYQAAKNAEDAKIRGASGSATTPSFINNDSAFLWPVAGYYNISAGYKSNDAVHRGSHNGIDISGGGISGKPIRAISEGYVATVSNSCTHNYGKNGSCGCGGGYGNYCVINHGTMTVSGQTASFSAYYAHAVSIIVGPGQHVSRGQVIGYVGTTGWSTGYHLHFGLLKNGSWVNPSNYSYAR